EFRRRLGKVATGVFGEHMHIDMSNDGPITMILEK
ncbi:MAG: D-aminoacyl-tRNA deacylase, partial [Clostridia bacterium]|nr:D-aminoacyl-tRNA deacylase [Clostridia bacterium]